MDWLAFEPEHAPVFARPRHGRPRRLPGEAMASPLGFKGGVEETREGGVEQQYQYQYQHHGPVPRWQPNSIPQQPLVQPAQPE